MKGVLLIARRELGAYFNSMWGYAIVAIMLAIDGLWFNAFSLGNDIPARDDANFATELAPERAEAWLERGRIETKLGDKTRARGSLLRAIELGRDGKIGRAAQLALQRMEAGIGE